jgi:tripartite-type tricarboxylate transporter receptor subunit TctC
MSVLRRRAVLAGSLVASLSVPAVVKAQADWPKGTIKFLVPFPPGGSTDPIARIVQAKLSENTGWNIVVENKPGGSGVVGAAVAAKAAPDGNTWLIVFDNHILNTLWGQQNLPYKDSELMPVTQIGRSAQGIAAYPTRPYNTFAEMVKTAKAEPGKTSVGALAASLAQIFLAFVQKENGFELNTIPYKGGGPLYQDALAGVTDLSITSLANMMPHVAAGKLKLIGDRMLAEIGKAVRSPDVTQKFVDQFDMEITLPPPDQFAAFVAKEQELWGKVIKDNSLKPE